MDTPDVILDGKPPGYGLLNDRVEFTDIGWTGLSAALFATNLLDEKYLVGTYSLTSTFGLASRLAGPPRMYGVEMKYAF